MTLNILQIFRSGERKMSGLLRRLCMRLEVLRCDYGPVALRNVMLCSLVDEQNHFGATAVSVTVLISVLNYPVP
jgi:hypothetical protein